MSAAIALKSDVAPSAKQTIHDLAERHGVTYRPTALDLLADKFTELADNNVHFDDTKNLIRALVNQNVITLSDGLLLMQRYNRERRA